MIIRVKWFENIYIKVLFWSHLRYPAVSTIEAVGQRPSIIVCWRVLIIFNSEETRSSASFADSSVRKGIFLKLGSSKVLIFAVDLVSKGNNRILTDCWSNCRSFQPVDVFINSADSISLNLTTIVFIIGIINDEVTYFSPPKEFIAVRKISKHCTKSSKNIYSYAVNGNQYYSGNLTITC